MVKKKGKGRLLYSRISDYATRRFGAPAKGHFQVCALPHFWAFLFLAAVVDFLRTETSLKSFLPLERFSHCL